MDWREDTSNSGDTAIESSFCEYCQDHRDFCTCQETTLPSSSPPSYHRSHSLIDNTNIDPIFQIDGLPVSTDVTQPYRLISQYDPPPLAAGRNYQPEVRAQQHAELFSGLPSAFNIPGSHVPPDEMFDELREEIDRIASQRSMSPVLPAEPTGGANGTNAHPTDANGGLRHGGCGTHSCSVCHKSYCKKNMLKRHQRSHNKPYVCLVCGAERTWANHLARHMATHRDGTVACPMGDCPKTFKTTANIPRHLQNPTYHNLTKGHSKEVMAEYKRRLQRAS